MRERLVAAGHRFRTRGDAETIVHLYEDEGVGIHPALVGYVRRGDLGRPGDRRLVLARDRLGKKPLVYRLEPGRLLFASELKSLFAVPACREKWTPRRSTNI